MVHFLTNTFLYSIVFLPTSPKILDKKIIKIILKKMREINIIILFCYVPSLRLVTFIKTKI